jgi:cell migration-inducing and hyaluronan-binding protein
MLFSLLSSKLLIRRIIHLACPVFLAGCGVGEFNLSAGSLSHEAEVRTSARSHAGGSSAPARDRGSHPLGTQRGARPAPDRSSRDLRAHVVNPAQASGPMHHLSLTQLHQQSASDDVVVAENQNVYINESISLGFIKVLGTLRCADDFEGEVQTDGILVMGEKAVFSCGRANQKFAGKAVFTLKNNRELSEQMMQAPHSMGGKAVVAMHGGTISMYGETKKSKYVRLGAHLEVGENKIILSDVVDWSVGDRIVVSSTSFYQDRAEEFEIVAIEQGNILHVQEAAKYRHYGQAEKFDDVQDGESYEVDQRAYVANLTRNIVFQSPEDAHTTTQLGAHMMVMHQGKAFIDGVEFFRVGQMEKMGRYPFHWHRMGDVEGQFIRNSSIHESYHRCVTMHNTHKARVVGNTCYDHYGHGFFLEEGNETKNIIKHNLGMQSKKIAPHRALLVSDFNDMPADRFPGPATYWISNPDNDVRFNVAAGSEGSGFWMAFQKYLHCSASGCEQSDRNNANVTPLITDTHKFSDNVAVSTVCGITWDGAADGDLTGNPLNPNDRKLVTAHYNPATTPVFSDLEIYKNARAGLYFRGEQAHFPNNIFADNGTAAFFAYNQMIQDSLMVGLSKNHSAEEYFYHQDQSVDHRFQHKGLFEGIRVYDGPFVLDNVFFADYSASPLTYNGEEYTPTPITLTGGAMRFVNSVHHVTFSPAPYRKFYLGLEDNNWQDSYAAAVLDIEGDLTGMPGSLIRPDHWMNTDSGCVSLANEASLVCPYELSYLRLHNLGETNGQNFDVYRTDGPSITHTSDPQNGVFLNKFSMIMDVDFIYVLANVDFNHEETMKLHFVAREVGDVSPVIAIASGVNQACPLTALSLSEGVVVPDVAALRNTYETAYTIQNGMFVFKVQADLQRDNISLDAQQGVNFLEIRCR